MSVLRLENKFRIMFAQNIVIQGYGNKTTLSF